MPNPPRSLARRYLQGESVLEMSVDACFPPCMLLRRMLEGMLSLPKQVR